MAADLYDVLGVSPSATDSELKQAYRRRSLETHPDRCQAGTKEQEEATTQFQEVNNAYYVLSDAGKRKEYDSERASGKDAGAKFSASSSASNTSANQQFNSAFEEMMADAGLNGTNEGKFYAIVGGAAGAILGFIIFNVPGALAGAVAGFKLGSIRDTRGKAVGEVFQELPHAEKARMLSGLFSKVMSQAQVP